MFIEEKRERTEVHKECKLISTKDGIIILKAFDGHRLFIIFNPICYPHLFLLINL